ncbi:hypothetical protein BB931_03150 [Spiribacter salinus]|nr:hypothetical protein [Spiribacter salinus]
MNLIRPNRQTKMLYRWLTESEESSRYWRQQAEENSASDFSLMLTLWAVEEVSKLPPSMVRDSAMLTLQIVEWDVLSRAIKEGVVLSDIWEESHYNA